MKTQNRGIFVLLLLFVSLCSFFVKAAHPETVWSFAYFGEDDFLYMPSDIEVDHARSLIYVSDSGNNRVLMFDFEGNLQKIIGREGQGPAEFSRPTGLFITEDGGLAVADHNNNRIQFFDSSGQFVKLIKPETVEVADLIIADDKIYTIPVFGASGYSPQMDSNKDTQPLANILDRDGHVTQSLYVENFPEAHPFLRAIKHRVCLTLSKDKKLFLPHFAMNVIHVFGLDGKKISQFDRPLPFKPETPHIVRQSQSEDGIIRMQATMDMTTRDAEIGPDGNLYLLMFTESFIERSKKEDFDTLPPIKMRIDVIDTGTYKLIRSIDIDSGARCFGLLDKNRLVYVYEDNTGELFLKCIED